MGVFDFLFGKPEQTGQLDPQTKAARDFLMNQMLMQYSAGPVNVPTYQAVAPSGMYSGANALLGSLGLETVASPSMPTTNVGGMEVYTSEPLQTQMEAAYAEKYPGQYDYLRSFYMDPVTGEFGERSYGYADPMTNALAAAAGGGGGGGGGGVTPRSSSFNVGYNRREANRDARYMSNLGNAANLVSEGTGAGFSFNNPGASGSYGGSLVSGVPSQSSADYFATATNNTGGSGNVAEDSFASDLSRSLTDSSYDPPGTVVSRTFDRMFGRG